jgi:hypothetical protein
MQDLTEDELTKLREEVDNYTVEGDLRRFNALNIKRLKEIGCYRGRRHFNVRRGGLAAWQHGGTVGGARAQFALNSPLEAEHVLDRASSVV